LSILYLHGFASSPQSRKALFFAEQLRSLDMAVQILDLDEGQFKSLTISRQLDFIQQHAGIEPVTLIGSSLGGYLAALYAARHPATQRVMLLAPAFGFYQLWTDTLGKERLSAWKTSGFLPVYHYGQNQEVPLHYSFLEDAARFEPFPNVTQPTLIFHGELDDVVPIRQSERFCQLHPQAKLIRFPQSGHELTDVLESMWSQASGFLTANDSL
jgi:uncharacterized protein